MFYVTYEEYKTLCETFLAKKPDRIERNALYSRYYEKYGFDSLCELIDNGHVVGFIMIFECHNIRLFALEVQKSKFNMSLLGLFNRNCAILSKQELLAAVSDSGVNVVEENIYKILHNCKKTINIETNIQCVGGVCFEVKSKEEIPYELIDEYLLRDETSTINKRFSIVVCSDSGFFRHIQAQFNTIQHLFQLRMVNKAAIVSEGNGHVFFSTREKDYIIGYQKYYNYADSPLTYYVLDGPTKSIYIFAVKSWERQVLRTAQALIAYSNILCGGFNLHASAVVVNNKAILLLGDKEAGKTTNMLFGIQSNPKMKIMSNDIVHLHFMQGTTFAIGSCRKATIRPKTVLLFPELICCIGDKYSSVGNPSSNNMQLVTSITHLAKVFNTTTQFFAPVKLFVVIEYSNNDIPVSIDWDYQIDWPSFINRHVQRYYDAKQKFWNDIFPCKLSDNYKYLKNIKVLRAVVNEKNIKKTWNLLLNYLNI